MNSLSIEFDKYELSEFYSITRYYTDNCGAISDLYTIATWRRMMENIYNDAERFIMVFYTKDFSILYDMSEFFFTSLSTDCNRREICGNIMRAVDVYRNTI